MEGEEVRGKLALEDYWKSVYPEKVVVSTTIDIENDGDVALSNLAIIKDGMVKDEKIGEKIDLGTLAQYLLLLPTKSWEKYLYEQASDQTRPFATGNGH